MQVPPLDPDAADLARRAYDSHLERRGGCQRGVSGVLERRVDRGCPMAAVATDRSEHAAGRHLTLS
jgi:hypothetical protein